MKSRAQTEASSLKIFECRGERRNINIAGLKTLHSSSSSSSSFSSSSTAHICCRGDGEPMQKSEVVCRGTTLRRNLRNNFFNFSTWVAAVLSLYLQGRCSGEAVWGIMPWGWCRQVLGILVSFLVAGCAIQSIYAQERAVGSSCYGGFDLYFVLDK